MCSFPAPLGSVACAGFGRLAPVVPGVCVPWFVAGGVPPRGARVRWGAVLGGAAASWRPGLVLSCLDVDILGGSCLDVLESALSAWYLADSFCGVPPIVASFWVLPSGAAVVASVAPLRRPRGGVVPW